MEQRKVLEKRKNQGIKAEVISAERTRKNKGRRNIGNGITENQKEWRSREEEKIYVWKERTGKKQRKIIKIKQ